MKKLLIWGLLFALIGIQTPHFRAEAQSELAAVLEVVDGTVEVKRVNTEQWITVRIEAIVGVGDVIRTGEDGKARIIFFADGTETELEPNTEYRIEQFEGDETRFNLTVSVLSGNTRQRLNRLLDANSSYQINTPGLEMVARGTDFRIRVEADGRSAMLVDEGNVGATAMDAVNADVPTGFGVRAATDSTLSDVVQATTFEALDSALDGCTVEVTTTDDVRLNVRTGPSLDFPRVGTIAPDEIPIFIGTIESGNWYRIDFRGGFGWVLASRVVIQDGCAGLRLFANDYGPEDAGLYESVGDPIEPDSLSVPTVTPDNTETVPEVVPTETPTPSGE